MEHVRIDRHDRVALVTLVDLERRNAMTAAMVGEIVDTFDALEADDDVGAVVITGEPPAFCSGADVAALGSLSEQENEGERRAVCSIYEGFLRVLRSSLPTVAAVNGPAVGAGLNLALGRATSARGRVDAVRHAVPAHRFASGRWSRVDARSRGRAADRGRNGVVRRRGRRRATPPRSASRGWCHPDDALIDERLRVRRLPVRGERSEGVERRRSGNTPRGAVATRLRHRGRHGDHVSVMVTRERLV